MKKKLLLVATILCVFTVLLFTVSFPLTLSIVIGNVDNLTHTGISLFEYLAALALCIYAVSKVYAYKYTIKFVMDTEKSSTHHSHKHRRHKADNASQENPTSTETK